MTARSGTQAVVFFAVALSALCIGGSAGLILAPNAVPPSIATREAPASMRPWQSDFEDARDLEFSLTLKASPGLTSPMSGLLTSFACLPGSQLGSGSVALNVDGNQIVGLATSLPLWRDIAAGTRGEDVSALEAELARLGTTAIVDGKWGRADAVAYGAMRKAAGATPTGDIVHVTDVVWLPDSVVSFASCDAATGIRVTAGDPLAQMPAAVQSMVPTAKPEGTTAGPRIIRIGTEHFDLASEEAVTDPAILAAVSASSEFAEMQSTDGATSLRYESSLRDPIRVTIVPPSAVYAVAGNAGCVQSKGQIHRVTLIASQLGQALIITETPGLEIIDLSPDQKKGCL